MNLTWKILKFECVPFQEGLQNVVVNIHFECIGQENVNGVIYTSTSDGVATIGYPDVNHFTPFENITKEQVIGWIEKTAHYKAALSKIKNEINFLKKPQVIEMSSPFGE